MRTVIRALRKERTRAYLYRVAGRAGGVAAAYGLVQESKLVVILALVGAVLGNELAARNTTTKPDAEDDLADDVGIDPATSMLEREP